MGAAVTRARVPAVFGRLEGRAIPVRQHACPDVPTVRTGEASNGGGQTEGQQPR